MHNILYVLCGNLSTTPRALQSAKAACSEGYTVKLIGISRNDNWHKIDEQLAASNKFDYEVISINRKAFPSWILGTLKHRVCFYLEKIFSKSITLKAYASSKENYLLWQRLKKETGDFTLVAGFSAHSLYPVWKYSQKHKIPFAFDVEDYYPRQMVNKVDKLQTFLLKRLLPLTHYSTYASPLIGQELLTLVGSSKLNNALLINNSFPESEFEYYESKSNHQDPKVHFVWFSQNIGANRGLELIIPELKKVSEKVQLHLIGNLYPDFDKAWILPNKHFITTYSPMSQPDLNKFICSFDIGLAMEINTADYNRQICLTNKIWAYLQAGLYIMASSTQAQILFMEEHPEHGTVFNLTVIKHTTDTFDHDQNDPLPVMLNQIIAKIEDIRFSKKERFEKTRNFSFENESAKYVKVWQSLTLHQV